MSHMPTTTELDQLAYLIAQVKFHDILVPDKRALILDLAIKMGANQQLEELAGQIEGLREDMEKHNSALLGRLESMESEIEIIADWFKASRVFDGVGELVVALERVKL
jgi:hypothetical protein